MPIDKECVTHYIICKKIHFECCSQDNKDIVANDDAIEPKVLQRHHMSQGQLYVVSASEEIVCVLQTGRRGMRVE